MSETRGIPRKAPYWLSAGLWLSVATASVLVSLLFFDDWLLGAMFGVPLGYAAQGVLHLCMPREDSELRHEPATTPETEPQRKRRLAWQGLSLVVALTIIAVSVVVSLHLTGSPIPGTLIGAWLAYAVQIVLDLYTPRERRT